MTFRGWIAAVMLLVSAAADAQTMGPQPLLPSKPAAPRVDPRFEALARVLAAHGPASPYFGPHGLPSGTDTSGVGATLRFERELDIAELTALEAAGVRWRRADGEIVRVGNVYGAFVEFRALKTLRSSASLLFAEVAWHPITLQPLDVTTSEVAAIRARTMPRIDVAGEGTIIGDIDSGADVLHPHLFRADGGAFEWIDTNGDGQPTAGIDHVDYDRNGAGDFNEILMVLDAAAYGPDEQLENDDGALDVSRDWLYIDANTDQSRNIGRGAGFTEFDPGYGEPTFVPDDANRNGVLDVDERVLLLASSKIERFVTTARTYTRGVDLIEATDVAFSDELLHGTGVASILVGGHPQRDHSGVAPGADLVMYASHMDAAGDGWEESGQLASIQDSLRSGVDVLVHEWTNPYTAPIDGAGNIEDAMLTARAGGVVQINPVGNLNLSEKHLEIDVDPAVVGEMQLAVGDGFSYDGEVFPYAALHGSIYWRTDPQPTFTIRNPAGDEVLLTGDETVTRIGADYVQGVITESVRGTRQLLLVIWNTDPLVNVAVGDWTIEVAATVPDRFVGRIGDAWSSWAVGVKWVGATAGQGTAVYPATADAAFGVAAYGGRHTMPSDGTTAGELRNFSGRGPRIDGARLIDIAAPDDPFAAWGVSQAWIDSGAGRSWFFTFGGTSGAAPHVAGAVALMLALDPGATPAEVEQRLLNSARRDASTGTALPDAGWGEGKLDVFAAVYGAPPRANSPPAAELVLDGDTVSAEGSTDADGDELQYRWDLDYDGVWDTAWSDQPRVELRDDDRVVRLDVRDGQGGAAGAVLRVERSTQMDDAPDAGPRPDATNGPGPPGLTPTDRPCGCASAAESATWTSFGLLLAVVARRRRRRVSRPC